MCVLCMFFDDLESGGLKKLWGRDFLNKNLLGYRVTENKQLFLGLTTVDLEFHIHVSSLFLPS